MNKSDSQAERPVFGVTPPDKYSLELTEEQQDILDEYQELYQQWWDTKCEIKDLADVVQLQASLAYDKRRELEAACAGHAIHQILDKMHMEIRGDWE